MSVCPCLAARRTGVAGELLNNYGAEIRIVSEGDYEFRKRFGEDEVSGLFLFFKFYGVKDPNLRSCFVFVFGCFFFVAFAFVFVFMDFLETS